MWLILRITNRYAIKDYLKGRVCDQEILQNGEPLLANILFTLEQFRKPGWELFLSLSRVEICFEEFFQAVKVPSGWGVVVVFSGRGEDVREPILEVWEVLRSHASAESEEPDHWAEFGVVFQVFVDHEEVDEALFV